MILAGAEIFVGRDQEIGALGLTVEDAREGRPRVAAVERPAGIGKTWLVPHVLGGLIIAATMGEATLAEGGQA